METINKSDCGCGGDNSYKISTPYNNIHSINPFKQGKFSGIQAVSYGLDRTLDFVITHPIITSKFSIKSYRPHRNDYDLLSSKFAFKYDSLIYGPLDINQARVLEDIARNFRFLIIPSDYSVFLLDTNGQIGIVLNLLPSTGDKIKNPHDPGRIQDGFAECFNRLWQQSCAGICGTLDHVLCHGDLVMMEALAVSCAIACHRNDMSGCINIINTHIYSVGPRSHQ